MQIISNLNQLCETKDTYVFGAGKIASRIIPILSMNGIKITGILVSNKENNSDFFCELPVYDLFTANKNGIFEDNIQILVAVSEKVHAEIEEAICIYYQGDLLYYKPENIGDDWKRYLVYLFESNTNYKADYFSKHIEVYGPVIYRPSDGMPIARTIFFQQEYMDKFINLCTEEQRTKELGEIPMLGNYSMEDCSQKMLSDCNIERYIITSHLDTMNSKPEEGKGLFPLQVGAALTDMRKGCLIDSSGDNISTKNRNYCECTGLYWMWRNTSGQKYIGLEHYRRRLMLGDSGIKQMLERDLDMVVGVPHFCPLGIKQMVQADVIGELEWKLLRESVMSVDSTYKNCLSRLEKNFFHISCNIFLTKREIFDKYCSFAFAVAFQIEDYFAKNNIERNDRYMGYIFEYLLTLFVMHENENLRIACTQISWNQI